MARIGTGKNDLLGPGQVIAVATPDGAKAREKANKTPENFDKPRTKERVFLYSLKIAADYFKVITKAGIYIYNGDPNLTIKLQILIAKYPKF